jgi:uncharacterized protein (TIGR02598 family)
MRKRFRARRVLRHGLFGGPRFRVAADYATTTRSREPSPRRSGFGHARGSATLRATIGRSGFSLVEIMLALAVIAIGLVAIIGLIPQGIQASRDAADNTLVATIVHDTFNEYRQDALLAWPPVLSTNLYYDAAGTNQVTNSSPDRYYYVHLNSQPSPSAPNLLVVSARVTWPDKLGTVYPLNTNIFVTSIANYQH